MERYTYKTQDEARILGAKVEKAIAGADTFAEWAPLVVEACRGCGGGAWQCYDDAGGNAHRWVGEEFYKVRQVRNHPEWFRKLYDAINAPRVAVPKAKRKA